MNIIVAYLFAFIFVLLPKNGPNGQAIQHIFSIIASITIFFALFPFSGFLELIFMTAITYASVAWRPSQKSTPVFVFLYLMTHLSYKYEPQISLKTQSYFEY
jgi:hypothetical protein